MEMFLQFGHGMMEHCCHLLERWCGGSVVLSPRDLDSAAIRRFSERLGSLPNTRKLIDPQFFLPHSDHVRLCSHKYWPDDYQSSLFWQGNALSDLLQNLVELNRECDTEKIILPGLLADPVNEDWLVIQSQFIERATQMTGDHGRLLATIALSADAAKDEFQIARIIEAADSWDVSGCYIVAEHPNGEYLVDNPVWLANILDLASGLKIGGKDVIIGYANHQLLIAALTKVDAICSGTWVNVRSFPPAKFKQAEEDPKKRATWYYCARSLSEYKIPFLDIAKRLNLLERMKTPDGIDGGYATLLFSGAQPTSAGFGEQAAFRHYLHCLHEQALQTRSSSFDGAVAKIREQLSIAEELQNLLSQNGIFGQNRDFSGLVDVSRAAIAVLSNTRGPLLRYNWNGI